MLSDRVRFFTDAQEERNFDELVRGVLAEAGFERVDLEAGIGPGGFAVRIGMEKLVDGQPNRVRATHFFTRTKYTPENVAEKIRGTLLRWRRMKEIEIFLAGK
jgi:hypothetical protein